MLTPSVVADHRDKYKPKTPPPGVRAQTARSEDTAKEIVALRTRLVELEGGVPEHEISDFEAETPVQIRRADTEVQQRYRRNRASAQLRAMKDKIGGLDNELLANLLWSEIADRREREERAATAQLERERAQMARDAEDARTARDLRKSGAAYRAKIILALIGLIGTALTAYFAGRAGV